jgi:TPP-dependent pyruvate/acetoin dehydrogenase alpha subunit
MEITSRFIVENNGYAMGTSVERTANQRIYGNWD